MKKAKKIKKTKKIKRTKKIKKILLIEDNDEVVDALIEGLKMSSLYNFKVTVIKNAQECVEKRIDKKKFDMAIIDLKLPGGTRLLGLRIVSILSFNYPGALLVVYSAFPQIENIITAIRGGAIDFISKAEYAPHQLVEKIERIFVNQNKNQQKKNKLDKLLKKNNKQWKEDYAGQVIVIVDDKVVASGKSRLEAMVRYNENTGKHPDWPGEPDVIEIEREGA